MFSLESPHRGDSNEYTQYTIFNIQKKISLTIPNTQLLGFFSKGLKDEFETAVVNEPPVFEPLKIYCIVTCNIDLNKPIITSSRQSKGESKGGGGV